MTYFRANREIRFTNDPADGSFMCQGKFVATAQKVQAEMDQALQALKKAVERRS